MAYEDVIQTLNNKYYIKSDYINVFPCAYRGQYSELKTGSTTEYITKQFDPESKLNTESNQTKVLKGGINSTYIISWTNSTDRTDSVLECVIRGYYFKIAHLLPNDLYINGVVHNLYIKLYNQSLDQTNNTQILSSWESTTNMQELDTQVSPGVATTNYCFIGLLIAPNTTEANTFCLAPIKKLASDNVVIDYTQFLPDIRSGNGMNTGAIRPNAICIGLDTLASGNSSFASGNSTCADGDYSHTEGHLAQSTGEGSHAEGYDTNANSDYSHAEGNSTFTNGLSSHAEGFCTMADGESAHAEGCGSGTKYVKASGTGSHAEGSETTADGYGSHAEGYNTTASNSYSHAEGYWAIAQGEYAHAEGRYTIALANGTHAEGKGGSATITANSVNTDNKQIVFSNTAIQNIKNLKYGAILKQNNFYYPISQRTTGQNTTTITVTDPNNKLDNSLSFNIIYGIASGEESHVEGSNNTAAGWISHAEGYYTMAIFSGDHAEGNETTAHGRYSHSEGTTTDAGGAYSHAEGSNTVSSGASSHAEGGNTIADGNYSHAEGYSTAVMGQAAHSEGYKTIAAAAYTHTEGYNTTSTNNYAHAEGHTTKAGGSFSHAEGILNKSFSWGSHAEGNNCNTGGAEAEAWDATKEYKQSDRVYQYVDAWGANQYWRCKVAKSTLGEFKSDEWEVIGVAAHAEGNSTSAIGNYSHSEGEHTEAQGYGAHAEGKNTLALYQFSHTGGNHTKSSRNYQTVIGEYNKDNSNALVIIGNGSEGTEEDPDKNRSNILEIHKEGIIINKAINANAGIFVSGGNITNGSYVRGVYTPKVTIKTDGTITTDSTITAADLISASGGLKVANGKDFTLVGQAANNYALKIDSNGKVTSNSLALTDTAEESSFVTAVNQSSNGQITVSRAAITVKSDDQGEINVYGVDCVLKDLQSTDSPTFNNITATGNIEAKSGVNISGGNLTIASQAANNFALKINSSGNVTYNNLSYSFDNAKSGTQTSFSYVTNFQMNSDGIITNGSRETASFSNGISQGSWRLNNNDINVYNLGTTGTPTFNSVTVNTTASHGVKFGDKAKIIYDTDDDCIKFIFS